MLQHLQPEDEEVKLTFTYFLFMEYSLLGYSDISSAMSSRFQMPLTLFVTW